MVAPPPTALSLGNPLQLRPEDSVLVTESSGVNPATLVIYARGRGDTNGQQLALDASCAIVLGGADVGGVVLVAGAASYVFGPRQVPSAPGGTTVDVNVSGPSPLPIIIGGQTMDPMVFAGIVSPSPANAEIPIAYAAGNAPCAGMWRGYAVATAAGDVSVNGVVLGSATAANQAFPFVLFVAEGSAAALVNCSVLGGGISL